MRDRPDGAVLAALAREANGEEPALVGRARAIAERERQAGAAPLAQWHAQLAVWYGAGDPEASWRRLANDIRSGVYDGFEREDVRRLLWAVTVQKLRESNPDYLAAAEASRSEGV
jgi:hypothetical protein